MAQKFALAAFALVALALAGCTSGGGDDGDSSTTRSGGIGVNGTVSGPGGGVGGNATISGSSTMTSTGSNGTEANMTADVEISDNEYSPKSVTIAVGGTVTWTNNGTNSHTVTGDDFDSSPNCNGALPQLGGCLTNGQTYSETFVEAGSFSYHCKVHASMTGTVTVVEA